MNEHVEHKCNCHEMGCMFCDGGLFKCDTCNSFEGATTTDCPGVKMCQDQIDAVYAGTLDYRNGAWIAAPSGSCGSHYGMPGLPDETKISES